MKRLAWVVVVAMGMIGGCAGGASSAGRTGIGLSGTRGATVEGSYMQDGQRQAIEAAVPWNFEAAGISSITLRKVNPQDEVVVDLSYDSPRAQASVQETMGPQVRELSIRVEDGFKVKKRKSR